MIDVQVVSEKDIRELASQGIMVGDGQGSY